MLRGHAATGVLLFGIGALTLACASGGEAPLLLGGESIESDGGYDSGGATDDSSAVVSAYSPTAHEDPDSGGGSVEDSPAGNDAPMGVDDSASSSPSGDSGTCNAPTCTACVSGAPCCTTMGTCGCTWVFGCIAL